jgi:surfactin synthase thioesterase subunit
MGTLHGDSLVCPKPRPSAAVQLCCFPNDGAGGSAYRGWADGRHPELEITWVLFPGRDRRMGTKPFTNIHELMPILLDAFESSLDRDFVFYGRSLGAKIAFETARELRRRGHAGPSPLFVGACRAPQVGSVNFGESKVVNTPNAGLQDGIAIVRRSSGCPGGRRGAGKL